MAAADWQQRMTIVFGKPLENMGNEDLEIVLELLKTPACCMAASACSSSKLDGNNARLLKGMRIACEKHARIIVMIEEGQAFVHGRDVIETVKAVQAARAKAEAKEKLVMKELRDNLHTYLASTRANGEPVTDKDVDELLAKLKPSDLERMKGLIRGDEKRSGTTAPSHLRLATTQRGSESARSSARVLLSTTPKAGKTAARG